MRRWDKEEKEASAERFACAHGSSHSMLGVALVRKQYRLSTFFPGDGETDSTKKAQIQLCVLAFFQTTSSEKLLNFHVKFGFEVSGKMPVPYFLGVFIFRFSQYNGG